MELINFNEDIRKYIYKWFDMIYQSYDRLDYNGFVFRYPIKSIYLYDNGSEYADIVISMVIKPSYYNIKLYDEFYVIFPLKQLLFEHYMTEWAKSKFNLDYVDFSTEQISSTSMLKLPLTNKIDINLENSMMKWFNIKYSTYKTLGQDNLIYLYDDGQEYADILINTSNEIVLCNKKLWQEFDYVFPANRDEFNIVMSQWVENVFFIRVFRTIRKSSLDPNELILPV